MSSLHDKIIINTDEATTATYAQYSTLFQTVQNLLNASQNAKMAYEKAAEALQNEDYQRICRQKIEQRETHSQALAIILAKRGDDVDTDGDIVGMIHRVWMDIKSGLFDTDLAIVSEIVRGEEQAVQIYQEAMGENLPDDVRRTITHQAQEVTQSYQDFHLIEQTLA